MSLMPSSQPADLPIPRNRARRFAVETEPQWVRTHVPPSKTPVPPPGRGHREPAPLQHQHYRCVWTCPRRSSVIRVPTGRDLSSGPVHGSERTRKSPAPYRKWGYPRIAFKLKYVNRGAALSLCAQSKFQPLPLLQHKIRIDVFYHRFGNGISGHTTRAPPKNTRS
jgi:hypothetical protein